MRLCVVIPSFAKHGGIRICIELARGFSRLGHEVTLYSLTGTQGYEYWSIPHTVKTSTMFNPDCYDTLLITSPHSIHLARTFKGKIFMHLQMLEGLFNPTSSDWQNKCSSLYKAPYPLFCISKWVMRDLKNKYMRCAETIYIGNGVNFEDFPIVINPFKNPKAVLVEGWEAYNPTKDRDRIGPRVAERLKKDGYKIMVYGQTPLATYNHVPDEYYLCPSLDKINQLYQEAIILLKASRYDCRSCSPVEAMTKNCVTVRAIIEGDDDLINDYNCLRCRYNEEELYTNAKKVLVDNELQERLIDGCLVHLLEECKWDKWISIMEKRMVC